MKKIFFCVITVIILSAVAVYSSSLPIESFEQKRERILNELSLAIEEAKTEGNYGCCIEPPCTMCYLGNWIWDDGGCYCDEMILKGEFDKVCPQCIKGIEEGKCISTKNEKCTTIPE
jgi:hypothetical protein